MDLRCTRIVQECRSGWLLPPQGSITNKKKRQTSRRIGEVPQVYPLDIVPQRAGKVKEFFPRTFLKECQRSNVEIHAGWKKRLVGECAHHDDPKTTSSFSVFRLLGCSILDFCGPRSRNAALLDRVQRKDSRKRSGCFRRERPD